MVQSGVRIMKMSEIYPKIIGISGITGAGKTTLTNALAQDLKPTWLSWDDFDVISTSPTDYVDWYHRGGNYSEWNYQALAGALHSLKSKQSVLHPVLYKRGAFNGD
jgi:uridine kinase